MATNIGTLMATIGVDTRPLKKGLKDAEKQTQVSTKKMLGHWKAMATGIVATYAIYKTANLIKETSLLAARFETLDIVMRTVGKNAGYSAAQMEKYDLALRKTGISMVESRQSLARMAMAQLDLNKATELGRIAQDAAVIGNINSSEAFERMIYGIQSGNLVVLKTIGINVSFEQSYKEVANAVGRTTESFSQTEKALIRQNAVLKYGSRIAGTYEAAMTTAGKKLTSFTRYIDDFKVKMGKAFGPATVILVDAATAAMKEMQEEISKPEAQKALKNLSTQLAKTAVQLGKDLPAAIQKTTSAIAGLQVIYNSLPEGVVGAAGVGLLGRMLFGSGPPGWIAASLYMINTQMEKIKTSDIWGGEDIGWGVSAIIDSYREATDALQKVEDEIMGRTIKGVPVEPLVKRFKVGEEPATELPSDSKPFPGDNWINQFKKQEQISSAQIKDMQAQEAFAMKMSDAEQERLNERYELEKEVNAKIRDELLSDTEFRLQQLDSQFLSYDGFVKDKAVLDEWYVKQYEEIMADVENTNISMMDAARFGFEEYDKQAGSAMEAHAAASLSLFQNMEDGLVEFCSTGKLNFRDFANSVISDLMRIYAKQVITGLVTKIAGAWASWASPAVMSGPVAGNAPMMVAKGGVFESSSLSKYSGMIVNQPTAFSFAHGAGIMGEAGPEAIMPLKRTSDGKLGVEVSGEGNKTNEINVTYNINAVDAYSFMELTRRNPEAISGPLVNEIKNGNNALRQAINIA